MKIICKTPSKNLDCKIQITVKKNSDLVNFFSNNRHCHTNIDQPAFSWLKQTPPTFYTYTPVLLKGVSGNFEFDFSIYKKYEGYN